MKYFFFLLLITAALTSCETSQPDVTEPTAPVTTAAPTNKVTLSSAIEWTPLNAARGDASPQAGTIWGDRNTEVPTGFLVKFKEGFSSPPHIHNITYRGMVIKGLVHNDDAGAEKMWMPAGSFWTQPAGEPHITAAKAAENMAYIEIDHGPYLVKPTDEAFDEGERPINIDRSNIVWVDATTTDKPAQRAYLWGDPQDGEPYGSLLKLPAGYTGRLMSEGSVFHAVVIEGELDYTLPGENESTSLDPGSSFSSNGESVHTFSSGTESVVYIRTNGKLEVAVPEAL